MTSCPADWRLPQRRSRQPVARRRRRAELFVVDSIPAAGSVDRVADIVSGTDLPLFDAAACTALAGGVTAATLASGTAATRADQHPIQNATTGARYYAADGSGRLRHCMSLQR